MSWGALASWVCAARLEIGRFVVKEANAAAVFVD